MLSALIDLNVILDVLQRREPFYQDSAQALAAIEQGHVRGYVAAHSITTLFYLFAKDQSPKQAKTAISQLMQLFTVAGVDHAIINRALALPYDDFEDAVQMAAAMSIHAGYLVTRNRRDFIAGPLPAISPAELIALLTAN